MPLHDFWCGTCGQVLTDIYRSVAEGAQARPPEHCGRATVWLPAVGRMDIFAPFETYDGRNRLVMVDSLKKLRTVERESERMAANGEGQHVTWRMYSQDRSNKDVNTHGPDPSERPDPTWVASHVIARHAEEPERAFGPAVSETNASALGIGT